MKKYSVGVIIILILITSTRAAADNLQQALTTLKMRLANLGQSLHGPIQDSPIKQTLSQQQLETMRELEYTYHKIYYTAKTRINAAVDLAKLYVKASQEDKELEWYINALNINLTPPGEYFDVYRSEREAQKPAADFIHKMAEGFVSKGNVNQAIKTYRMAGDYFKTNIISLIDSSAQKLEKEGKIDEAIQLYQLDADSFQAKILGLQKEKQAAPQLKKAQELANKKEFPEALKILQELINKGVAKAAQLLQTVNKQKTIWDQQDKKESDWIKCIQMRGKGNDSVKDRDWRIQDEWLEFNLEAKDLDEFTLQEIIEEADDDDLPCLIAITKTKKDDDYSLFDMRELGRLILTAGPVDPRYATSTKDAFKEIICLVKGKEDTKFQELKVLKQDSRWGSAYKNFFRPMFDAKVEVMIRTGSINPEGEEQRTQYTLKKEWKTKGQAQNEVGHIFAGDDKLTEAAEWYSRGQELLSSLGN